MKLRQLQKRGAVRIRVSGAEMSALRKIVLAGLLALEGSTAPIKGVPPLTTSERKAMAYWGGDPFKSLPAAKPFRRPRTPVGPQGPSQPARTPRARSRAAV